MPNAKTKEMCLQKAVEITKLVAQGHQHPDSVLRNLYNTLVELQTEVLQEDK